VKVLDAEEKTMQLEIEVPEISRHPADNTSSSTRKAFR